MRRVALYGIGWIAAAAVAVLLAWQGVGLVGRNVTDNHLKPLTADEARQALGEAGGSTAGTGPATTSPAGDPAGTASTNSTARPGATTATTRSTATAPTTAPTSGPTATTSPSAGGTVRTYNLAGGSTALRFDPSGVVTVVWAHPNPGFRADIDDRDDGGVRVRFEGESGRSQVEAWWDGGPQDRLDAPADDENELDDD